MKKRILAIMMAITLGVISTGGVAWAEKVSREEFSEATNSSEAEIPNGGQVSAGDAEQMVDEHGNEVNGGTTGGGTSITVSPCSANYTVLGLVPWYNGLTDDITCEVDIEGAGGIEGAIGVIIGNISFDLFTIIAYLAVGYIIYSGYLYLTSAGDPGKAAKAQKSMTGAIVGMMIGLLASAIVGFVVDNLALPSSGIYQGTADDMIRKIIELALGMAGIVAVCMTVYGGVTFATSAGDANKVKKGKNIILYSVIGLVVVLLSWAIVEFVTNQMGI